MALNAPKSNKMMTVAPVKKQFGFHFPPNGEIPAFYVEVDSIEEASELYEAHVRQSTPSPAKLKEKEVE